MKRKLAATYLVVGVALAPMAIYAADSDTDSTTDSNWRCGSSSTELASK